MHTFLQDAAGTKTALIADPNGALSLYHNNSAKLATSASGVTVTGTVAATSYTGDGSSLTGVASTVADGCIMKTHRLYLTTTQ